MYSCVHEQTDLIADGPLDSYVLTPMNGISALQMIFLQKKNKKIICKALITQTPHSPRLINILQGQQSTFPELLEKIKEKVGGLDRIL